MAIGDNNEKYYAPTYRPTTYASDEYANQNYGDGGYWQGDYYDPDAPKKSSFEQTVQDTVQQEMKKREGSEGGKRAEREFDLAASEQSKAHNYSRENNFGFEDIGMVGDIAGAVGKVFGGPIGMALGAPNRLDSISQNISIDNARKALGLPGLTNTQKLGGVVSSRKGVVANVTINDEPYTVTFDPNPKVKTEITPEEALKKSIDVGVPAVEVSPVEAPEKPGVIGNAIRAAKEALTGVKEAPVKDDKVSQPAAPSTPSLGTAPAATPGYNPDNQQQVDAATRQNVSMNAQPSNPASVASSKPSANAGIAPGFGNLAGISRDQGWAGSKRPGPVDPGLESAVQDAVGRALGPGYSVSITSGMGEYGKANHRSTNAINGFGAAMDFHVTDDLTGKTVTAKDKLDKVALSLAESGTVTGIGYGKGYMGGVNFHADKVSRSTQKAWGQGESKKGMMKNDPELYDAIQAEFADTRAVTKNFADTMAGKTAPTIGTREAALQQAQAQQAMNAGLSPADQMSNMQAFGLNPSVNSPADLGAIARNAFDTQYGISTPAAVSENQALDSMSNVTAGVGSMTPGLAMGTMADDPTANVGVSQDMGTIGQGLAAMNEGYTPGTAMTPANFSAVQMGYQYSPEQIKDMSYAIAGELGPTTLKGLVDQNPTAVNETAAVLGTIDNRVNAVANVGYKDPLGQALTAYDSVTKGFAATNTARNYAQYGPTVQDTVKGLLDGTISAQNPAQQTTHYANMSEVSPSWGKTQSFKDTQTQVGAHTFGTPDKSMRASVSSYGTAYGPNAATSLSGISGQTHTPGAMYGAETTTAGTPGGYAAAGTNALGGGLALGGGYVSGDTSSTTEGSTNSGLGGTSSSANGNTSGSGDSGSSSSGNGNSAGSGGDRGGSDGAGSSGSSGGSSGGLGGRGGDDDHDGGDGRGR